MKLLPLLVLLTLPLVPLAWGRAPGGLLRPRCQTMGACSSCPEHQDAKAGSELPWMLAYVPMRSCHRVLRDTHGEFSPPAYRSGSPLNFWCNWTIWAGSRRHIIIYIQGFITKENCSRNNDKILFEGVSSLVENDVVYACWKKEMHVFATFAQAVHVVLLKRYLPNCRDTQFKGKYYIFQHQEGKSLSQGALILETPAPRPSKQDGVFQPGWADNAGGTPGFVTLVPTGSPVGFAPYQGARTQLLGAQATCVPGLRLCQEDQVMAGGTQWLIPTTTGDVALGLGYTHQFSSMLLETHSLEALQVAEPSLQPTGISWESRQSVLHPALGLEDLRDLQFAIKPTHASHADLAACSQASPPDRRGSQDSISTTASQGLGLKKDRSYAQLNILADGATSSDADGLAKGLMPSLSSPYSVLGGDRSQLLPERHQSSSGTLPVTQPSLGTTDLQYMKLMDTSPLESSRGVVEEKAVPCPTPVWNILQEHPHLYDQSHPVLQAAPVHPVSLPMSSRACSCPAAEKAPVSSQGTKTCCYQGDAATQTWLVASPGPAGLELVPTATSPPEGILPPGAQPMSRAVLSPLMALGLDPASLRPGAGVPPGGQEMASSLPHHPSGASELGAGGSPGHLGPGMREVVLEEGDQRGGAPAPAGVLAAGPSPASSSRPCVGPPRPKEPPSHGSGVAPAPLHPGTATSSQVAPALLFRGFKTQKTTEGPQAGVGEQRNASLHAVHSNPPAAKGGQTVLGDQELPEPSSGPVSRNVWMPGRQPQKHAELGLPWVMEYFPVRSCHAVFQDGFGMFYLPPHGDIQANIWCNWTIWAGPQKHIVIYIQGFQGSEGCSENHDKIIFQGVLSRVETQVTYACHNRGTLIFAAQAAAVRVLFFSGSGPLSSKYKHFKGWYYVFGDHGAVGSLNDIASPQEPVQETSKGKSWRTGITQSLLPLLRASVSPSPPPAADRIQAKLASSEEKGQHLSGLVEDALLGANSGEYGELQGETELERSLTYGGTEGREPDEDLLEASARGAVGLKAELPALEMAEGDVEPVSAPVTVASCCSADVLAPEAIPHGDAGLTTTLSELGQASSLLSSEMATMRHTQMPPPKTSTKPPLHPSSGVPAGDALLPGETHEDPFDLASVLASLENSTALQSLHHPGDVLFEVTTEIKHQDRIPLGGSELRKDLLESMKNHIQQNLKLSANRVNEIKLKEVKRTSNASLLLTFWLHLKPEERNVSLLLHSQLGELLGASVGVEKLQLVSLLVEDVNECSSGVSLCGEEAECFNGVGTYLCRCKKDYEDHSPTKSGTLCIRAPRSGMGFLLRHADILVGAAIMAGLAVLVAAGALCGAKWRRRHPGRAQGPEEPPERAVEEPVMELRDLGDCLRLDPFQLKLRARPPEWLWGARAHPGQAYRVFLEQSPLL